MNTINSTSRTAIITTTKAGKKLSKRAAKASNLPEGSRVGCDTVKITLSYVGDYNSLIMSDIQKILAVKQETLHAMISEKVDFAFTENDLEDALRGVERGRQGILTSLQQTIQDSNPDNTHLEAYEPHPSGWGKIHTETGDYHLAGLLSSYEVIERDPNRPAPVNSGVVVLLKNAISKILDLDTAKWRQFKVSQESVTILP